MKITSICWFITLSWACLFSPVFGQSTDPIQVVIESRSRQLNKTGELTFDPALYPFYHGVASGDPLSDRVIIWTRVTPNSEQPLEVIWRVSTDPELLNVVKKGTMTTDATRDYTVKVDVIGLSPNTTYYYGFEALGRYSLTGRTKTTPIADQAQHLRFAVVSCNNYESGYFNAFARIGERNDLDAVVHLGDYIYEYEPKKYGDSTINRINVPDKEIVELADYRTRYSLYRLDPDLRRAHQQHPFIAVWDDHESANDSHKDGAENHQPETEGSWERRKNISKQAYFEWIPVRDNAERRVYRTFQYGSLAELIMLDTRLEGRQEPPMTVQQAATQPKTMLGTNQYQWFTEALSKSKAKWKLIGNQVIFSELNVGFINPARPDSAENLFLDIWDGYPQERKQIIDHIANNKINNVVFLTGDFHSTFAFDVTPFPMDPRTYDPATGRGSVAVEFATSSITSNNFDEYIGPAQAAQIEFIINKPLPQAGNLNFNPHMKNVDLDRNGYLILDVTDGRAQADWFYVGAIREANITQTFDKAFFTANGENRLQAAAAQSTNKTRQDTPAPINPPRVTGIGQVSIPAVALLTVAPNPMESYLNVNYYVTQSGNVDIRIMDLTGKTVQQLVNTNQVQGFYNLEVDSRNLAKGTYVIQIQSGGQSTSRKVIKD
jgi:alkaline phosphatase D